MSAKVVPQPRPTIHVTTKSQYFVPYAVPLLARARRKLTISENMHAAKESHCSSQTCGRHAVRDEPQVGPGVHDTTPLRWFLLQVAASSVEG